MSLHRRAFLGASLASVSATIAALATDTSAQSDHAQHDGAISPILASICREMADTYNSVARSGVIRQEHLRRFAGSSRMLHAYATQNQWDTSIIRLARNADINALLLARPNQTRIGAELKALGFEKFDASQIPDGSYDMQARQQVVARLRMSGVTPYITEATQKWDASIARSVARHGLINTPQRDQPRVLLVDACDDQWGTLIDGLTVIASVACEVIVLLPDVCPGLWATVAALIVGKYMCKFFSDGSAVYP